MSLCRSIVVAGSPADVGGISSARFIKMISNPKRKQFRWDGLGRPMAKPPASPIWKRWRIDHESDLETFKQRASHLHELLSKTPRRIVRSACEVSMTPPGGHGRGNPQ